MDNISSSETSSSSQGMVSLISESVMSSSTTPSSGASLLEYYRGQD